MEDLGFPLHSGSASSGSRRSLCLRGESGLPIPVGQGCLFSVVSRLGDGGVWYLLMLVLAVNGETTALVAGQMAVTSLVGTVIYKLLKARLVRERPYIAHAGIELGIRAAGPLQLSLGPHPARGLLHTPRGGSHPRGRRPLLVPFTLLVGASRIVLGLHYPSDVIAGAVEWGHAGRGQPCSLAHVARDAVARRASRGRHTIVARHPNRRVGSSTAITARLRSGRRSGRRSGWRP